MSDNPMAFPSDLLDRGMFLRDWFAGQALAGLVADGGMTACADAVLIPQIAYAFADRMLTERAKEAGK